MIREALIIIKNEILNDPANVGYAGKSYWDQAALINAPRSQNPPVYEVKSVEIDKIVEYLLIKDLLEPIIIAAQSAVAGHNDAFRVIQFLQYGSKLIGLENPAVLATIDNLVSANLLSAQNKAEILSLQNVEVLKSRAEVIGAPPCSADDIEEAFHEI